MMLAAVPTPREQEWLVGHEPAERVLLSAFGSARLHHAWLLAGPAGIGKATLAFRFARWLLAGGRQCDSLAIDAADPVFRRVASGTHADLLTIARGYDDKRQRIRTEIVADDVRPVGDFLRRTAAEGGWRVVVLDGAEFLNRNAANALLKLLEEPPARVVLLLVCAAPGRLLPTIRSRCRTLRLEPLDHVRMELVLERLLPQQDAAGRHMLLGLSHGSPGRALSLAGEGGVALERLVQEVLSDGSTPASAYQQADAIQRQEGGFDTFLNLLADAIADRLQKRVRENDAARDDGASHWISIWQEIRRVQDETERFNLDKRQALISSLGLLSAP